MKAFEQIYNDPQKALDLFAGEESLSMSISTLDNQPRSRVLEGPAKFCNLLRVPYRRAFIIG